MSADVEPLAVAVAHGLQPGSYGFQVRVVIVQEDGASAFPAQVVIQFSLGAHHSLKGAEALQVCLAYVGDEAVVGFGYFHQFADVAGVVGSHFHYGQLVLGLHAQQGKRYADVVVQVALGVEHVDVFGQYGGNQFFRGCLSVGAGNAQQGDAQGAAVQPGQLLQGLQAVVDKQVARVAGRHMLGAVDHGVCTACLQRFGGKGIAIEVFAFQGNEQGTCGAVAAVGCHTFAGTEYAV